MAKLPPIPVNLLLDTVKGEPPIVIGAFIYIVTFWIERGKKERLQEHLLERLSQLPTTGWRRHEKRLKELVESFYEPFIEHWCRFSRSSDVHAKYARIASGKKREREQNSNQQITKLPEPLKPLFDERREFSYQPVKMDRTHERTTRFITDNPNPKLPAQPDPNFKPKLRDQ
jgi:hypothetical protein